MGRIYDALYRAKLSPGCGIDAANAAPYAAPWTFEERERADAHELATPGHPWAAQDGTQGLSGAFDAAATERLVVSASAGPLLVEQFRSLAATLVRAQTEPPVKSIMVTSASPGDGKSHVATNLALTLSDSYRRRVLLIDADLRSPSLHVLLQVSATRGLAGDLKTNNGATGAVQLSDTLTLLPAGRPDPNPLACLTSSNGMRRVVADAASRFDWVIVDSPPVGVLADARLLSEMVDVVMLVVKAGVTQFPDVVAAVEAIGRDRIVGIVLNAVDPDEIQRKDYYHRYYRGDPGMSNDVLS